MPDNRSEWDQLDFDNAETIAKHGWVVLAVDGEPGPGWSYTIGLTHTVGTPVWTDREACFPWNRDFDDEFTDAQPSGWFPPPTPAVSQWGRA